MSAVKAGLPLQGLEEDPQHAYVEAAVALVCPPAQRGAVLLSEAV